MHMQQKSISSFRIYSFYRFVNIQDKVITKKLVDIYIKNFFVRGTILIADEGINGSISGTEDDLESTVDDNLIGSDASESMLEDDGGVMMQNLIEHSRSEISAGLERELSFIFILGLFLCVIGSFLQTWWNDKNSGYPFMVRRKAERMTESVPDYSGLTSGIQEIKYQFQKGILKEKPNFYSVQWLKRKLKKS